MGIRRAGPTPGGTATPVRHPHACRSHYPRSALARPGTPHAPSRSGHGYPFSAPALAWRKAPSNAWREAAAKLDGTGRAPTLTAGSEAPRGVPIRSGSPLRSSSPFLAATAGMGPAHRPGVRAHPAASTAGAVSDGRRPVMTTHRTVPPHPAAGRGQHLLRCQVVVPAGMPLRGHLGCDCGQAGLRLNQPSGAVRAARLLLSVPPSAPIPTTPRTSSCSPAPAKRSARATSANSATAYDSSPAGHSLRQVFQHQLT